MKYILITILFFNFLFTDINKKEVKNEVPSELNMITIKIVDIDTKEELFAVKNIDQYTDFNGEIKINKGDSISLELISYEKVNIKSVSNDTIIGISRLK
jgi:hypothetical protein